MIVAKVVRSDGHVSIELPLGFSLEGAELSVRKEGEALILEPIETGDYQARLAVWLASSKGRVDQDFIRATEEDPGPAEDRDFRIFD